MNVAAADHGHDRPRTPTDFLWVCLHERPHTLLPTHTEVGGESTHKEHNTHTHTQPEKRKRFWSIVFIFGFERKTMRDQDASRWQICEWGMDRKFIPVFSSHQQKIAASYLSHAAGRTTAHFAISCPLSLSWARDCTFLRLIGGLFKKKSFGTHTHSHQMNTKKCWGDERMLCQGRSS